MNIAIAGYGRMGRAVEKAAMEKGHHILARIDAEKDWKEQAGEIQRADVVIEFSTPSTVVANVLRCFDMNLPVVTGTTAWEKDFPEVKSTCLTQGKSLFVASNFSVGVNIFFHLNRKLANMMNAFGQYDPTIEEIHHVKKLDRPSGTAKQLADDLVKGLDNKTKWSLGENGGEGEIPVISHRLEDVPGTHIIRYESPEDTIEIKHTAKSRAGFARGAVKAAEWLIGKKGVFTMDDLLADMLDD
jgi:4-hydroxy-tetrahydrodipicolinate reductase